MALWFWFLIGLTSQSTVIVMSRWSVYLNTLFLAKLRLGIKPVHEHIILRVNENIIFFDSVEGGE